MTKHLCDSEFPWCPSGARSGEFFKWANFFRTRILLDQDILAGKQTFDEFAFVVDEHGLLIVTDDGKEVLDEALFLASGAEARGLPGFRASAAESSRSRQ